MNKKQFLKYVFGVIIFFFVVSVPFALWTGPASVDDYFRTYFAWWWWEKMPFTVSHTWLPGYFYIYGTVIGLTWDLIISPRILTVFIHILAGIFLLKIKNEDLDVRLFSFVLFLFSPLLWVLGFLPLSESLLALFLIVAVTRLNEYVRTRHAVTALVSGIFYGLAAFTRYEAWAFCPVFSIVILLCKTNQLRFAVRMFLAFLPWIFPVTWMLLLAGLESDPFFFLKAVSSDQFGPGSILSSIKNPGGGAVLLFAVTGFICAACMIFLKKRILSNYIFELHIGVCALLLAWVIASDNIPSQIPLRIFYPVMIFSPYLVGKIIFSYIGVKRKKLWIVSIAAAGTVLGIIFLTYLPGKVEGKTLKTIDEVQKLIDNKNANENHVLIQDNLPESAAILVYINRPGLTHPDKIDQDCRFSYLECEIGYCPTPNWVQKTSQAVLYTIKTKNYFKELGWIAINKQKSFVDQTWSIFTRPSNAPVAGSCLPHMIERLKKLYGNTKTPSLAN